MKKTIGLFFIIICFFQMQEANAGKQKVLLIGLDGVRSDVLKNLHTPAIEFMSKHGFGTYESWHQDITISGPSWSSILCGVYHDKHGVTDNSFDGKKYHEYPMLPLLAKQLDPNLKFGMYMEWKGLLNNSMNNGWDQMVLGEPANTNKTTEDASNWLVATDLDFYFVYYEAPDFWGHRLGFSALNPFYVDAIQNVDHSIASLMTALRKRINYQDEDWLILITTDHGGNGFTHGEYSMQERELFWFAYSDRIHSKLIAGIDAGNINSIRNSICPVSKRSSPVQTDITVTALHHLLYETGCDPEDCYAWKLDGKSWLKEMGLYSNKKSMANIVLMDPGSH